MKVSEREILQLVQEIVAAFPRDESGAANSQELQAEVARQIPFDEESERYKLAARALAKLHRPNSTPKNGQVCLPGLESWSWEPQRLIDDENGERTVEAEKALPEFTDAEAARARHNARHAQKWANRKTELSAAHVRWANQQLTKGRHPEELMLGNFLRETGCWLNAELDRPDDSDEAGTIIEPEEL